MELQLGGPNHSIYHVLEYEAKWTKNINVSLNKSYQENVFSWELISTKLLISKERIVMKLMYPNMNKETFDINGIKYEIDGCITIPNSEQFRLKNECMFTNIFEYYKDKEHKD